MEMHDVHQHPLTLFKNVGYQRPPCPVCRSWESFNGCFCDSCSFRPGKCSACEEELLDCFYFCQQCLPKSPCFHESCTKLPQQIQIALRPHCNLHLKSTPSSADMYSSRPFFCDFCQKSPKGSNFCCHLCNFHICALCTMKLIKYHHQDRQHIQHIRHHHPLVLLDMEEVEDTACHMCYKNIRGQSYCCAPCGFYIHKSCSELLQKVRHPFHLSCVLTLQKNTDSEKCCCNACQRNIDIGLRYRCHNCDFDLHTECMSLKPIIKYGGHQHPLTLVENLSYQSKCQACGLKIEGTFFVRCVNCDLDFHVRCGPVPLPEFVEHQHHDHPLTLVTNETLIKDDSVRFYCDVCNEDRDPNHPSYGCNECQYYAHVRCVITEIQVDYKEKVAHFSHNCFLFLLESNMNDDIKCYACNKLIQAHPVYGCNGCRFYLHKSCFELPKLIRHISHLHYLTLQDSSELISESDECKACGTHLDGLIYCCKKCDFSLDLDCAEQHPSMKLKTSSNDCKYQEDQEVIGHYSHYHHLTLLEVGDMECKLCFKDINGLSYGCAVCMFYIHKSCSELPQEVRHPFHPRHSLTLQENTTSDWYLCDACCFYINPGMRYRCDGCRFDLHLECVPLKPNIKYQDHQHLVILVENIDYTGECQACRCDIEGTLSVRCVECDLDFHVQCGPASLAPTIVHPHHDHPLIVTNDYGNLHCDICQEERNPDHYFYSCVECEYYAHVGCVVTEVLFDEREKLEHFSHEHFLFPVGNERNHDDILCSACKKFIQAHPAYGCDHCEFYLHKSCIELPRQIQHIFHRHPLTLKSHPDKGTKYHQCGSCNKNLCGFFYQCDNCFVMDVDCASLSLGSKFEGDEYILTLFEKLHHTRNCRKLICATSGALDQNCVKCNFIVYLFRSPLPQTIECRSHQHSLTLIDNVDDVNFDNQVCDVCEEERDPQLCVYYCLECDFVAEFICVISEVLLALPKKHCDVQLRSIGRKNAVNVIRERVTLKDMNIGNFQDLQKWVEIKLAVNKEKEEIRKKISKADTSGGFVYSDHEDLLRSLAAVNEKNTVDLFDKEDYEYELIDVGDYKIIPRLAGVLENLLDKYGDIGANCTLEERYSKVKASQLVNICAIVDSMCNTTIQDVTDELLYTWWRHFNIAHRTGFKVEFIFEHLKRIAQARRKVIDARQLQFGPIHYYYDEKNELAKEIEGLAKEIDKRKAKMDLLTKKTQEEISNIRYRELRSEAEQVREAREFGMMKAAGMHTAPALL